MKLFLRFCRILAACVMALSLAPAVSCARARGSSGCCGHEARAVSHARARGSSEVRGPEARKEVREDKCRCGCRWQKTHERRVENLTEVLSLTAEQKEKLSVILSEGREDLKAKREEMMKKAEASREAADKKIEEILTEDQRVKFREHRAEIRRRRQERKEKSCVEGKKPSGPGQPSRKK